MVSPPYAPPSSSWLPCWPGPMLYASSKAGLRSFPGSLALQSSKKNEGEDHTLGWWRPSCSAAHFQHQTWGISFPFLIFPSPCLTNNENISPEKCLGYSKTGSQRSCTWTCYHELLSLMSHQIFAKMEQDQFARNTWFPGLPVLGLLRTLRVCR